MPAPPEPLMGLSVQPHRGKPRDIVMDKAGLAQLATDVKAALDAIRAAGERLTPGSDVAEAMVYCGERHPQYGPHCELDAGHPGTHMYLNVDGDEITWGACPAVSPDGDACTVTAPGHAWHYGADTGGGVRRQWQDAPVPLATAAQCPAGLLREGGDWADACKRDAGHEPPHQSAHNGDWDDSHPRHLPDLDAHEFPRARDHAAAAELCGSCGLPLADHVIDAGGHVEACPVEHRLTGADVLLAAAELDAGMREPGDDDTDDGGCLVTSPAGSGCTGAAGHDHTAGTSHRDVNGRAWGADGWIISAAAQDSGELPRRVVPLGACKRHPDEPAGACESCALHEQRLQAVRDGSPAVQDGPYAYLREDGYMAGEGTRRVGFMSASSPVLLGAKVQTGRRPFGNCDAAGGEW